MKTLGFHPCLDIWHANVYVCKRHARNVSFIPHAYVVEVMRNSERSPLRRSNFTLHVRLSHDVTLI
jgi:hypothetical protein